MADRDREPRRGPTFRIQKRIAEARRLLVSGVEGAPLLQALCAKYGVKENQARIYVNHAIDDLKRRDAICPDANIARVLYAERLLGEYRALERDGRGAGRRPPNVHAVRTRVEIAERLAELDGVRPRDPDGDDGGGFTLVLDLEPEPGGDNAA